MTLRWLALLTTAVVGLTWAADDPVVTDMERGANRFLRALHPEGRVQATIPFSDEERYKHHRNDHVHVQ
jgi:hypothetical protein